MKQLGAAWEVPTNKQTEANHDNYNSGVLLHDIVVEIFIFILVTIRINYHCFCRFIFGYGYMIMDTVGKFEVFLVKACG